MLTAKCSRMVCVIIVMKLFSVQALMLFTSNHFQFLFCSDLVHLKSIHSNYHSFSVIFVENFLFLFSSSSKIFQLCSMFVVGKETLYISHDSHKNLKIITAFSALLGVNQTCTFYIMKNKGYHTATVIWKFNFNCS